MDKIIVLSLLLASGTIKTDIELHQIMSKKYPDISIGEILLLKKQLLNLEDDYELEQRKHEHFMNQINY